MSHSIMKLTRDRGQTRVTLPRELIQEAGLEDVELVYLYVWNGREICIEEYHGKGQEKRDVPEGKA